MTVNEKVQELRDVLRQLHKETKSKVPEALLEQIVALAVKNPLQDDRKKCQDQIQQIISNRVGGQQSISDRPGGGS